MTDSREALRPPGPRGCLGSAAGLAVLALMSPFVVVVQSWRRWRRGDDVRKALEIAPWRDGPVGRWGRVDATMDVPLDQESGFRRHLTDAVVRIAESQRRPDDVYNMIYRLPSDEEALVLPVGPQLQELGERFFLALNQGSLSGRTVVWLTLGRDRALAQVVDPVTCDPEAAGEPDGLLATPEARWAMASEWARIGPSLVIRLILIVPVAEMTTVRDLLAAIGATPQRSDG